MTTTLTQTLWHHQQEVSSSSCTIAEALATPRPASGWRYGYAADVRTPDLLVTPHDLGAVTILRADGVLDVQLLGEEGAAVDWAELVAPPHAAPGGLDLGGSPAPWPAGTTDGWHRSRVAGWVRVESSRPTAWASDATARARYERG